MASIKKKTGKDNSVSYLITVSLGYDNDGKKITKSTTFKPQSKYGTKNHDKELNAFTVDFEKKCSAGEIFDGDKITFSSFVDIWMREWAEKNLTSAEAENYMMNLKNHVISKIGHFKISKIKALHCQGILSDLEDQGKKAPTVKRVFTSMNSVFKYAYRMNLIQENPCDRCFTPKIEKDDTLRYFTLEQSKRFLDCLKWSYEFKYKERKRKDSNGNEYTVKRYTSRHTIPLQFQAYFTLASYSGARRGELIALTWDDIDFNNSQIRITKAVAQSRKEGIYLKKPKTSSGIRVVTVPYQCMEILMDWQKEEKRICSIQEEDWNGKPLSDFGSQYVFIQEDGNIMHPSTVTHKFKEILLLHNRLIEQQASDMENEEQKKQKLSELLPDITLHDLRHTSATLLVAEGMDIATIAKRLGHSKISTTLNIYTHAIEAKDREAGLILETLYSEPSKPVAQMDTVKVSIDEKKALSALRNADTELQQLILEALNGNYSADELRSYLQQNKALAHMSN